MRALPAKNEHPVLYAAAACGVVLVAFVIAGFVTGAAPEVIGRLSGSLVMAGAMLAGWGSIATGRWSRLGFFWRLLVCWAVLTASGLVCGVPMK